MQMANNTQKHKWAIFRNARMALYGGYWENRCNLYTSKSVVSVVRKGIIDRLKELLSLVREIKMR